MAQQAEKGANHILISPVEHHAVTRTAQQLASVFGFEVEYLPVDSYGRVDPSDVARRIRPTTAVVSVIYANNEIGTIQPVAEIGRIAKAHNVLFHVDGVQAVGKIPLDLSHSSIDLLSLSGHKLHAPKGVGILYVRKATRLVPFMLGGHQEGGRRAGTENVPGIVGLGKACELAAANLDKTGVTVTVTPTDLTTAISGTTVTVRVSAPYTAISILPTPWFLKTATLYNQSAMRHE